MHVIYGSSNGNLLKDIFIFFKLTGNNIHIIEAEDHKIESTIKQFNTIPINAKIPTDKEIKIMFERD